MEPAAVDSSIVDRDSPRGLHPERTSDPGIATEQPKIPSRALGFHHRAEIAVERFEILIGSQPFSIGWIADESPWSFGEMEVSKISGLN